MNFHTYEFILLFLPIVLLIYFQLGKRCRSSLAGRLCLLLASAVFYVCFSLSLSLVMLASILVNYGVYVLIVRTRETNAKRCNIAVCIGVLLNIGALVFFKYTQTLLGAVNSLFQTQFVLMEILVPVGISFFTFSQISFLLDSKDATAPRVGFLDYALYILFFPKIVSGPIMTAKELIPQFHDENRRHFNADNFAKGIFIFALGLAKKVLFADTLAIFVDSAFGSATQITGGTALVAIVGFTLQLYFDFSGYCDMARGVGLLLNFDIAQNFNAPYRALDIQDFWKRWHMTLTSFLTRYLYYPLGGNRKGRARQCLNILIVFLVSGIWHGAGLPFLVWGLLHGVANVLTRLCMPLWEKVPKLLRRAVTFLFVTVTWVFFRAQSLADAIAMLRAPFSGLSLAVPKQTVTTMTQITGVSILSRLVGIKGALLILLAFGLVAVFFLHDSNRQLENFKPTRWRLVVSVGLLCWSILSLTGFSSFLYGAF